MKRRSSTCGMPRSAPTAARALLGVLVAATLAVTVSGNALAVPPPPPNPTDADINQADTQVQSQLGAVGDLINQVAAATEQLRQLDNEVALKREEVNKALVDLQNARDLADVAAIAVNETKSALDSASQQIVDAQKKFDGYVAMSYTQGNIGATSVASYLGSATPDEVIDRAQVVELISQSRARVLDELQRARTEQANKDSLARKSKQDADAAAAEAVSKKEAAQQAIAIAESAAQDQADRKAAIESQRNTVQSQLDAARVNVAGLQEQRVAFDNWDAQRISEEAAISAAAETAQRLAQEAAARLAANQAARDRAAELADGRRPHTQLDEPDESYSDYELDEGYDELDESVVDEPRTRPKTRPSPSVTGSDAVETVVDRAMSQLGVTYAWGGGDENGPTRGIKDGGVADSYGDYKKIGFDCSGLMLYAFAGVGIELSHYSGYQYTSGKQVPLSQKKRGDMLFWGPGGSQHVALYLGDGMMIEAPQSGGVVQVTEVREDGIMPYAVRLVS